MLKIDFNADVGEGAGNEEELMKYISSANIACGGHAGDEEMMKKTVALAIVHDVCIGAHPGYADKPNFGRKEMNLTSEQIVDLVAEQIYTLSKITLGLGGKLSHVKPHGALYNLAGRDSVTAAAIVRAVALVNPELIVFGLSGSLMARESAAAGLFFANEVFADRTYLDDGSLSPRSLPNAVISDPETCIKQVLQMVVQGSVTSLGGKTIHLGADTLCLHGDGLQATVLATRIHASLLAHGICIDRPTWLHRG